MVWTLKYLPEVEKDLKRLGGNQRILVQKALKKVQTNPLPISQGGYGKPLGHKGSLNLSGLLKIKLRGAGIRIVYKLITNESEMLVVVIGTRVEKEAYKAASLRMNKYDL